MFGWEVASGGWQMTVVDPDGLTLGGEFAGRAIHVEPGTFFIFGDHKIKRSKGQRRGRGKDPIVIRFNLESDEWGAGSDGGSVVNVISDKGLLHSRLRSVITFPPLPKVN